MRNTNRTTRYRRALVVAAAVCVLLAGGLLVSVTVFLNGQGLRERVQTALSAALGRPVFIGSLRFSPATGSAVAHDLRIADDPGFGPEPFVEAEQVRLGLALWPLLLRRQVQIGSFDLRGPHIRLVRGAGGRWNYESLGRGHGTPSTAVPLPAPSRGAPTLAVSHVSVEDGQMLVRTVAETGAPQDRVFDRVGVTLTGFDRDRASPFRVAVRLPAGGSVVAIGSAGPWNRDGAAGTPASAHITAKHLDLAAAGLVGNSSRLTGVLDSATVDLDWSSRGLHVATLTASSPALHLRAEKASAAAGTSTSVWNTLLDRLTVDSASVHVGTFTVARQDGSLLTAQAVDAAVHGLSPGASARFQVGTALGGGSVHAVGSVRSTHATEGQHWFAADMQLTLHHVDLTSSGLLPRGSALRGVADADVRLSTSGTGLLAEGDARVGRLVLARNGRPTPAPASLSFRLAQARSANGRQVAGSLQRADISFGGAVLHVAGGYSLGAEPPVLDLHVTGTALPIDGVESFLPAAGVELPQGSRLSGGTLTVALAVQGTPAALAVSGPVRLDSTSLAGFDLGARLTSLSRWTGGRLGSTGATGTAIRSLSLQLHTGQGRIATDDIAADVAGLGKITGSGTVTEGANLHYNLLLKLEEVTAGAGGGANLARGLAGALPGGWAAKAQGWIDALARGPMRNGIPLLVGGTASHPTVPPNLGALFPAQTPSRPSTPSPWPASPSPAWPSAQRAR